MGSEPRMDRKHEKYERLLALAKALPPLPTAVVHSCDESSLTSAVEAAQMGLIAPATGWPDGADQDNRPTSMASISLDSRSSIRRTATHLPSDGVRLVREGRAECLMKGSLHTDELMGAVVAREGGLRTARRISHCFVMDVPTYAGSADRLGCGRQHCAHAGRQGRHRAKRDRSRATPSALRRCGSRSSRRWRPSTPRFPSTIEAAALCKMADRGQITGGILDGPLALDNAINLRAAEIKNIKSPVAGRANVLIVPDLEAGNMLAKSLSFLADADAAGIVLGARVPIILTSRADSITHAARLLCCRRLRRQGKAGDARSDRRLIFRLASLRGCGTTSHESRITRPRPLWLTRSSS